MRAFFGLVGLASLTACGVPSNPEKGPVVLLCEGEEISRGANGDVNREHRRTSYKLDGVAHTLAIWNDQTQSFATGSAGLTVAATEVRYIRENPILAGMTSTNRITFDRVTGRVADEFVMENGGTVVFTAPCKPVKDPKSETKF